MSIVIAYEYVYLSFVAYVEPPADPDVAAGQGVRGPKYHEYL